MKRIILVGFMGSGKSTVGKKLGERLALPLVEMDLEIEKKANMTIPTIFSQFGEDKFREIESDVLRMVLGKEGIIATGGGVLTQKDNVKLLERETSVIYLKGNLETLIKHIQKDKRQTRPLANNANQEELNQLLLTREPDYQKVSDITISIDGKSINEITECIIMALKEWK